MRKSLILCICLSLTLSLSGCNFETALREYFSEEENMDVSAPKKRVYIDEITGQLIAFKENQLTLTTEDDNTYTFDVSSATLESSFGIIRGDEISVIYEGQLADTDTSAVKALKVVDKFREDTALKEKTASCTLLSLTSNTLTIQSQKNQRILTFPTTGVTQYFQNGLKAGDTVHIHYQGNLPKETESKTAVFTDHVKVLSISDIEPLKIPKKSETQAQEESLQLKRFTATVQGIDTNVLHVSLNPEVTLNIDLSSITSYFKDGFAPGSIVTVYYTGDFNETTLDGISIYKVTGRSSAKLAEHKITSTVSGTIIGQTANTVTLQTNDGATVICSTEDVPNAATKMELGWGIKITFNPSASRNTTILHSLKIEDA